MFFYLILRERFGVVLILSFYFKLSESAQRIFSAKRHLRFYFDERDQSHLGEKRYAPIVAIVYHFLCDLETFVLEKILPIYDQSSAPLQRLECVHARCVPLLYDRSSSEQWWKNETML